MSFLLIVILQITGGSSGIGKHLAIQAINRGAAIVTLIARNKVTKVIKKDVHVDYFCACTAGSSCNSKGRIGENNS